MDYGITAGLRSQTLGWASWEDKQRYVTGLITKGTASTMATGDRTSTSALSKKSPPAKLGILFTEKAHILNDALFGNLLSKKKIALQNLNYVGIWFCHSELHHILATNSISKNCTLIFGCCCCCCSNFCVATSKDIHIGSYFKMQ